MNEDAELVGKILKGDREAFAGLVEKYKGILLALGYAWSGSRDEAEDLAQETFVRAYSSLASLREPGKLGSWLQGIMRRVWEDRLRDKPARTVSLGGGTDGEGLSVEDKRSAAPDESSEKLEIQDRVLAALNSLPPHLREVVVLRHMLGYGYAQIAAALGVSVDTVDTRLRRARAALRGKLRDLERGA